jgi:hypothetical protein
MKIMSKQIKEDGSQFLVYVMDSGSSPLACDFATNENKTNVINTLIKRFGNIEHVGEMSYNEYINQ